MKINLKKLGPGLLFAGAAIGVSHLVQSTRAGADFGWGLLWALLLANFFKYPFFQFGSRYTLSTQQTLLDGYHHLGKTYLWIYFFLSLGTMFTIQTAVTIVTASLASVLFGVSQNLVLWSGMITLICLGILWIGNYRLLDKIIKLIIMVLTISTLIAVGLASQKTMGSIRIYPLLPQGSTLIFLAAFMGWMPAPLDISIWQSLWAVEKNKEKKISVKEGLFDFNLGYLITIVLAVSFMGLGAFVMNGSGTSFSSSGAVFAKQLIELYTSTLGNSVYYVIVIAAFTAMLSTTLTTLDASPRAMEKTSAILYPQKAWLNYQFWIIALAIGTVAIFSFLLSEMALLVQIATVLSFVTAPFYAYLNYRLVMSDQMPREHKPGKGLQLLSILGIIFLGIFALAFLLMV